MIREINWEEIMRWDEKYLIHTWASAQEYHGLPIAATEGNYLIMPDGTRLLDFFNQLYCVNAGQRNPYINARIKEALDRYGFLWDAYTSDYKATAAKLIIEDLLGKDGWAKKVRFANTGGEAVELACIFARHFTGKPVIATREYSYHGYSAGAGSVTAMLPAKSSISKAEPGVVQSVPGAVVSPTMVVPAPFCYRCSIGHTYPGCKKKGEKLPCILATERLIRNKGLDQVGAIITETIHGASTIHPPAEYLPQLRQLTKELGIVWITDEILVGCGRTGSWFAYQNYGVVPDIMTVAKGIVNSQIPASACIVNEEIAAFIDGHRWNHVSTFSGHPIAMAGIVATLEYMLEHNLPEKARISGKYLGKRLHELEQKHKSIGLIAGSGQLWQVELVKDRKTGEPIIAADRNSDFSGDQSKWPSKVVMYKAIEKGVLIGGFVPNTLRVGASLEVTNEEIDQAIAALDYALDFVDAMI
ncbi:MAG: aspartate aminotransferase family protein [Bacillota bacterium]